MNQDYFDNYGCGTKSYDECWLEYSISADAFLRLASFSGVEIKSVFDVGAATGDWLLQFKDRNLELGGIEIFPDIVKDEAKSLIQIGDIFEYEYDRFWDVCYLSCIHVLDLEQVKKIICCCKAKVIALLIPFFDITHCTQNFISYESMLLTVSDWIHLINSLGFRIIAGTDSVFFIEKGSQRFDFFPDYTFLASRRYLSHSHIRFLEHIDVVYNDIHCFVSNASVNNLIKLTHFLTTLRLSWEGGTIRTTGVYDTFVPGWQNEMDGTLRFTTGLLPPPDAL